MKLPFTREQFLEVFKNYNIAVFPAQLILLVLAACVIFLIARKYKSSGKTSTFVLAVLWLWMGAVYHIAFFTAINKAAYVFGALFIFQGILLCIHAFKAPTFAFQNNKASVVSIFLLVYALIIYPLIGYVVGHGYPYSPTFGLPCPTTIFTLAVFLLTTKRVPFYLAVIPLLWSVIGFSAAFALAIYEDTMLLIAGLVFTILNFTKPRIVSVENAAG
jgi:hypothetical protein